MRRSLLVISLSLVALATLSIGWFGWSTAGAEDDEDDGNRGRGGGSGLQFDASLSGAQEVSPPAPAGGVVTETSGDVMVRFSKDLSEANFRLRVFNGKEITQAHFHCGRPGENGPVVVFLFGLEPDGVDVNGELSSGTLTNASFTGADCLGPIGRPVNNIASLAFAMRDGLVYANAHSIANPPGEVRGQMLEK